MNSINSKEKKRTFLLKLYHLLLAAKHLEGSNAACLPVTNKKERSAIVYVGICKLQMVKEMCEDASRELWDGLSRFECLI